MRHYDIKFHSNDENRRVFYASFRSETLANKFIERYQNAGGFRRFDYDDHGWNDFCGNIELVPCNSKGFKIVMHYLGDDKP